MVQDPPAANVVVPPQVRSSPPSKGASAAPPDIWNTTVDDDELRMVVAWVGVVVPTGTRPKSRDVPVTTSGWTSLNPPWPRSTIGTARRIGAPVVSTTSSGSVRSAGPPTLGVNR